MGLSPGDLGTIRSVSRDVGLIKFSCFDGLAIKEALRLVLSFV